MLELIQELYPYFIKPLIITLASELLCLLVMKQKSYKIYLLCFCMNIITNLSLNIVLQHVENYYLVLVLLEVAVVFIEAGGYYWIKRDVKKALFISVICNIISYLIGVLLL